MHKEATRWAGRVAVRGSPWDSPEDEAAIKQRYKGPPPVSENEGLFSQTLV